MRNYLRIGKIISLHGIVGEVKVYALTDDEKRYDKLKKIFISDKEDAEDIDINIDESYEVTGVKYVKKNPILKIKGFDKIEDSTKLVGKSIYIDRADAVKLDTNEFFIIDVIGMKVVLDGKEISTVKDVMKTKANSIIVFDYKGTEVLVPTVTDFIEKIDVANNLVYIKTIEGLI